MWCTYTLRKCLGILHSTSYNAADTPEYSPGLVIAGMAVDRAGTGAGLFNRDISSVKCST